MRGGAEFSVCHETLVPLSKRKEDGADNVIQFHFALFRGGRGNPRLDHLVAVLDAVALSLGIPDFHRDLKDVQEIIQKSGRLALHLV